MLTVLTVLATFLSSFTPATALTSQSITFTQPAAMTFPTSANQTLTASASSNLKVTFTSTTPSVCLVGTGNKSTVQPLAVGTCTIRAAQAGSKTFSAAASVDKSFDITAYPLPAFTITSTNETVIVGNPIVGYTVNTSVAPLGKFSISPLVAAGLSFSSSTGRITGSPSSVALARTYTITATNLGGSNQSPVTFTLTVNPRSTQVVTWAPTTTLLLGRSPLTPSTLATTSGNGAITYRKTAGTSNCAVGSSTGILTYSNVGTCVITATASQTSTYASATQAVTFTITAPSNNAALSALSTSASNFLPGFAAATIAYTASVLNAVDTATVTATINQANATLGIRINSSGAFTPLTSATPSSALPLNVGSNTIEVKVTAQDGTTTRTYTITVSRAVAHAVTYAVGDHGTGTVPTQADVSEGASFTVASNHLVAATGYHFVDWYDGTNHYAPNAAYLMSTSAVTLTATWAVNVLQTYQIGDTGPGGGIVYYYSAAGFLCGPTHADTCNYLEVAPNDMSATGSPSVNQMQWSSSRLSASTNLEIGTGATNTQHMVQIDSQLGSAGTEANAFRGGGFSDWFLPSKDELNQLYLQRSYVSGLSIVYWSSSEDGAPVAWGQAFDTGLQSLVDKGFGYYVRPIRAFAAPLFSSVPTYTLSETPTVGTAITASIATGSWAPATPTLQYQWNKSANGTTNWTAVTSNSGTDSYTPTADDHYLQVVVTASSPGYADAVVTSSPSTIVTNPAPASYALGATGPGGGIVYYYNADGFNCGASYSSNGSPTGGLCHYLEVAPSGWGGTLGHDPNIYWSNNPPVDVPAIPSEAFANISITGIGLGFKNSVAITAATGAYVPGANYNAAAATRAYVSASGGLSDWYLPTIAELHMLCLWDSGLAQSFSNNCNGGSASRNSAVYGANLAGIDGSTYLSSSLYSSDEVWYEAFATTNDYWHYGKNGSNWYIRAIRAF